MASLSGSATSNPRGGEDVTAVLKAGNENVAAGVFASSNTAKGPVTTGAFAGVNSNGHGLSVMHSNTPGVGSSLSESARVNLFSNDQHQVNANAFHSRNQLENGLKFDKVGGNMAWEHAQGHGASVGVSKIPQFGMTSMEATAKANLWSSTNGAATLDVTGQASRGLSGPFAGQNNFGAGMGFTHRF